MRAFLLAWAFLLAGCASRGWDPVDVHALAGESSRFPDDRVLVLLDEVHARYLPDPTTGEAALDQTIHTRVLILRETEEVEWAAVQHDSVFHVLQDFRARVIRPDGSVKEYGRADAIDAAAFTDNLLDDSRRLLLRLESPPVGSVIEWAYTLRSPGRLRSGAQGFQGWRPVKTSRLVVDVPEGWEVESTAQGEGVPAPEVSRHGGTVRRTWEMRDLPPLRDEPLEGRWLGPQVYVRLMRWTEHGEPRKNFESPKDVSAFVYGLFGPPPPLDPDMKELAAKVAAETQDPVERTRRLYEWVRDEVKYCSIQLGWGGFRPIPASEVFRGRYGDCKGKANLLRVLLAELGIRSHPVLIYLHGPEPEPFRMERGMFNFNHAILQVELPSGPMVLDPTSNAPFGELPLSDQEADLLPLTKEGSDLIKARGSGPEDNVLSGKLSLRLDTVGNVQGEFATDVRGGMAPNMEYALRGIGSKYLPDVLQRQLGRVGLGLSKNVIQEVQVSGGSGDPLVVSGKVNWSRFASPGAGVIVLRLADVRDRWMPAFREDERRSPIALGPRRTVREVVELQLPGSAKVASVPPPARVEAPGVAYDLTWRHEEGKVVAERTMVVKELAVPQEAYPTLKDASQRIRAAETQAVVLELAR